LREEVIFSALNEDGDNIRGIVSVPENASSVRGVLILGAGVNPRQSWHGLSVKIARLLADVGFYALRIDPRGVGDSDGEIEDIDFQQLEGLHDKVQTGLFTTDCLVAMDEFRKLYHLNEVYIIGLCGGALTGLYLVELSPDIKGLIYIAGPVTLTTLDVSMPVHPAYAKNLFTAYMKKALNPIAWIRFISGKSEYKTILFLIKHKLYKLLGKEKSILDTYAQPNSFPTTDNGLKGDHLNPMIPKAFMNYMNHGGKVYFINAELDPAAWGFYNLFAPSYLERRKYYKGQYDIGMVKNSNHTFSSLENQKELMSLISKWIIKAVST